jgi:thioredoxin-like negative regulator of GroEL
MTANTPSIADLIGADDARLLVEAGFMAVSHGFVDQADAIFRAVLAARPEGEAGQLGAALVELARNRPDLAASRLRTMPGSDSGQAFLGMALARLGDAAGAREVLERLIRSAPDAPASGLARDVLAGL